MELAEAMEKKIVEAKERTSIEMLLQEAKERASKVEQEFQRMKSFTNYMAKEVTTSERKVNKPQNGWHQYASDLPRLLKLLRNHRRRSPT